MTAAERRERLIDQNGYWVAAEINALLRDFEAAEAEAKELQGEVERTKDNALEMQRYQQERVEAAEARAQAEQQRRETAEDQMRLDRKALDDIAHGCSFKETEVEKAVYERARIAVARLDAALAPQERGGEGA